MVEGRAFSSSRGVRAGTPWDRTAARSLQAGLTALSLLFVTFATFGPWFNAVMAYVLTGASFAAGVLGVVWAHEAYHRLRRDPTRSGSTPAGLGALASVGAIAVSVYFTGLLAVIVSPLLLPIWTGLFVLSSVYHRETCRREDASRRARQKETTA